MIGPDILFPPRPCISSSSPPTTGPPTPASLTSLCLPQARRHTPWAAQKSRASCSSCLSYSASQGWAAKRCRGQELGPRPASSGWQSVRPVSSRGRKGGRPEPTLSLGKKLEASSGPGQGFRAKLVELSQALPPIQRQAWACCFKRNCLGELGGFGMFLHCHQRSNCESNYVHVRNPGNHMPPAASCGTT